MLLKCILYASLVNFQTQNSLFKRRESTVTGNHYIESFLFATPSPSRVIGWEHRSVGLGLNSLPIL
jgi:hypothetical protein